MDSSIRLDSIYDKNINFLFGAGASYGLFPTLRLAIKDLHNSAHTIETLAAEIPETDARHAAIFMHYYRDCIYPAQRLSRSSIVGDEKIEVLDNYAKFLGTVLRILARRKPLEKKCNVFTTNYDPCFEIVADELIQSGTVDFVLNDGTRGFRVKHLQPRNFNTYLCQTGIFERDQTGIPQINLLHLHGCVHWRRRGQGIVVEYSSHDDAGLLSDDLLTRLTRFSEQLGDAGMSHVDLEAPAFLDDEARVFMSEYNSLPIISPTKWKFHETVFEEHYYQMLRLLSYELEKPNAVLVTFGFSFADEHILHLLKRSLANPRLQVFVCCHSLEESARMQKHFSTHPNVTLVGLEDEPLSFTKFNDRVFSTATALGLHDSREPAAPVAAA